jgi:hypothetical protein
MQSYTPGQPARLQVTHTVNGVLTASTNLTLKVKAPDNTITTKTLTDFTNPSTGVYFFDFPTTGAIPGMYAYSFVSTSGVLDGAQDVFFVQPLLTA